MKLNIHFRLSVFVVILCAISCNQVAQNKLERVPYLSDTLLSNTSDDYTVQGDTIPVNFMNKKSKGMLLKLFKNGSFLFQDTLFPNPFGLDIDEFPNTAMIQKTPNVLHYKKKYELFVLTDNQLLIDYWFPRFLYFKNSKGCWKSFNLDLYPQYISRYKSSYVFPDQSKLSFVGENADLAGSAYKGDSLVVKYQNNIFKIDSFYRRSKLPGIKYYE